MLKIEGQRIYLRDHQASDLDVFHAWLSDPNVTHYLSWRSATLEESFIRLANALQENHQEPRTKYFFAIILKTNNCVIGDAGFTIASRAEDGGVADLGYFLLKPYWGQGYATEATQAMIGYCFTILNLHKVMAGCDADNFASEQVMKKCGMEREAYRKRHLRLMGEWRDRLEYALLYDDWMKRQGS